MKTKTPSIIKSVTLAMLTAVAFVLFLWEIPIFPSLGYLKLDFSDIPALIGALYMGPLAGIIIEFMKNLIELLIKGIGSTMGYGNIMNFIVGCSYIIPFTLIFNTFKKSHNKTISIVFASITSIISIVLIGFAGNYFIAPFYFTNFLNITLSNEALKSAIIGASALNLVKGAILSILSFPIIFALLDKLKKSKN